MKEKYLHFLWRFSRIPFHILKLKDGRDFQVLNPGIYNETESGPDFFNVKIQIDGLLWIGNVELHVRSKDWYLHGHHLDPTYDSVLLHVVFEDNGPVLIHGIELPTLILKPVIDLKHYAQFEKLQKAKKEIPCSELIGSLDPIHFVALQEKALVQRLGAKTKGLDIYAGSCDPSQVLYFLIARAMGGKVNRLPFEELATRLPIHHLKNYDPEKQKKMIRFTSGIEKLNSMKDHLDTVFIDLEKISGAVYSRSWKFGGIRPSAHPDKRIEQFSWLIEHVEFDPSFVFLEVNELKSYLLSLLKGKMNTASNRQVEFSKELKTLILINCFVPFIYWYGNQIENSSIAEKAFDLLRLLPAESNSKIKKWNKIGVKARNAAESQALLEIFDDFCSRKKCLSCEVGNQILKP